MCTPVSQLKQIICSCCGMCVVVTNEWLNNKNIRKIYVNQDFSYEENFIHICDYNAINIDLW